MSKKEKNQVQEMDVDTGIIDEQTVDAVEERKAKKREAAKRFKENRAKEKTERQEKAKALIDGLKANGLWDKLDVDQQGFINSLANPVSAASGNNQSLFRKMFGDSPAVGQSVTLNEAFVKTLKGKAAIDADVRKWAAKGIIVKFTLDSDNILNSVYTIEALGE